MVIGLLLLQVGCDPDACGPPTGGTEACPVDECAAECWSPALAMGCCIDAHGRGIGAEWERYVEENGGRGTGEVNPNEWLSPESALCIAQVHGLPAGKIDCDVYLENYGTYWAWMAYNTTQTCNEVGSYIADLMYMDVQTGELISEGAVVSECEP